MTSYEIKYENGTSHHIHQGIANSLQHAIQISDEGILSCLPEGFDSDNLVKPVIARQIGVCVICGNKKDIIPKSNPALCITCVDQIQVMGKRKCIHCDKVYATKEEAEVCEQICEMPF